MCFLQLCGCYFASNIQYFPLKYQFLSQNGGKFNLMLGGGAGGGREGVGNKQFTLNYTAVVENK
jgi:hypothetical protein